MYLTVWNRKMDLLWAFARVVIQDTPKNTTYATIMSPNAPATVIPLLEPVPTAMS